MTAFVNEGYTVWAVPPKNEDGKAILVASFTLLRWQWALKLISHLELSGYTNIELRKSNV